MSAAVDIQGLYFRYPHGREVLHDVRLCVKVGECIGLIGPNGAGKSTLLLHLNGLLPDALNNDSPVSIMGQPVIQPNLHEIRRQVGLLFQDPDDQLFCPTVFEDVAFGPRQFGLQEDAVLDCVRAALTQMGLDGFEKRQPHHLSGGEKRRVCLAGVLACKPEILVLDEPTSDLDPRGKRELKRLLAGVAATKIIATHDLELVVELCHRTVVLDAGRVVADGPTVELLSDEGLMLSHGLEKPHILQHRHPHS